MEKRSTRVASQRDADSLNAVGGDPIATAIAAALASQQQTFQLMLDTQTKAFQACLQTFMEATNARLDNFVRENIRDITDLKASVQFSQIELLELKNNCKQDAELHKKEDNAMEKLCSGLKQLEETVDYLENQSRRNNVRIEGVKERPGETWMETEEALRRLMERDLKLPPEQVRAMHIERAHRTGGAPTAGRDRTLIAKFAYFKDKEAIQQAARAMKPQGLYVNEDYSQRVLAKRRELLPKMREARERGKIAYLSFDKLVIKERQGRQ